MAEQNVVPPKVMEQIYSDFGRDYTKWPEELQDLFNPTISARQLNAPSSSSIKYVKNTKYHYHMAKDVCGSSPDHTRVEEMLAIGWEFATTDDVEMSNDFTVRNRKGGKPNGFSNEIRNGDLRLMKIDKLRWREKRKSENAAAYQMAYPQVFSATGRPMSTTDFTPGLKTELVAGDPSKLNEFESRFTPENTSVMEIPKER